MANRELDCTTVKAQLPLYVGGDLDEDVQAGVTAHLGGCEPCCRSWRCAVSAREALLGLRGRVTGAGIDLWSDIRDRLRSEGRVGGAAPAAPAPIRPRVAALISWPTWAAAACLLTMFWLAAGERHGDAPGAPETNVAGELAPADPGLEPAFPLWDDFDGDRPREVLVGERLRKVGPDEERLGLQAQYPNSLPVGWSTQRPATRPVNELVGRQR